MKHLTTIFNKLFLVIFIPLFLAGCSCDHALPNIEQLYKDLGNSIQRTNVNYGNAQGKLSDIYKLLTCEEIQGIEKQKGSYQIQFKGGIELLDTIYNYGNYGFRTAYQPGKMGFISYKGKVAKGTVVPFTGNAEYALTKNGWEFIRYTVKLGSAIAPSF